jgi:hypothetical protein
VRADLGDGREELARIRADQRAGLLRDDVPAKAIFSFLHLLLDGLAIARAAPDTTIDLRPILKLARDAICAR